MQGFLIWGAFTVAVAAFCVWRPQGARIFVGLFFAAMGIGIHGAFIATNPHRYVDFAADAPWGMYRDIGRWLIEPNPLAFGIFMLLFEIVTAALILSRGRHVRWGLLGAILFLLGITPLGLEEVPNVILAAGLAFLLTKDFSNDVCAMLRRHRRRTFTTSAGMGTSHHDHGPDPEVMPGLFERDLGRRGVSARPQRAEPRISWTTDRRQ
jgi:hypothetical protein